MGLRILYDQKAGLAAMYCSTSDFSFGPVFSDSDVGEGHDADERAEAFIRWLKTTSRWSTFEKTIDLGDRDPRLLTDSGLSQAYSDWQVQEAEQWTREEQEEAEGLHLLDS